MSGLPPDIEWVKKNRVNLALIDYFQTSANPSSTDAISFKGVGIYTHIEARESFSLPGSAQRRNKKCFLPLGGPEKVKRRGGLEPELPDDVKSVYAELKCALEQEETLANSGEDKMPIQRFGQMELPQSNNMSPASMLLSAISPPPPTPPPPPPPIDEEFLSARRRLALDSIDQFLKGDRETLEIALDKSGWPTKFTSVEAYSAPDVRNEAPWSTEDIRALQTIKKTCSLPNRIIASTFFPGRSKKSMSKKTWPVPNDHEHSQKRKTIDGGGLGLLTYREGNECKRRHSLPETRDGAIMSGTMTESPLTTTVKEYYADRDPRMRGR